ncbi:MAG: hypothetical protein FWH05_05100 [Oscillospiraceae bacterium]|nr:hypothetical protein [Oscillospiraceae bacterium]
MKIEVGESLVCSWLRQVKDCQMVQTNWMASQVRALINIELIEKVRNKVYDYFSKTHSINIYKDDVSLLNQMLSGAQVDVLGVSLGREKNIITAVDISIHENGLNYGSNSDTVGQVIKKFLQIALCLHGYFDYKEAEIIFVSPKIEPDLLETLVIFMKELQKLFEESGLNFELSIYANQEFTEKILVSLMDTKNPSTGTDLFLRGYQMLSSIGGGSRTGGTTPEERRGLY